MMMIEDEPQNDKADIRDFLTRKHKNRTISFSEKHKTRKELSMANTIKVLYISI